jgi:hypothetical protein
LVSKISTRLGGFLGIPVVDFLLGRKNVIAGQTIAIYGSDPMPKPVIEEGVKILEYPRGTQRTAFDLYSGFFTVAREALEGLNCGENVILRADFRTLADACKSLEFQSGHALPVSAQSVVGSILQLSHVSSGKSLTVVGAFNNASEFGHEASQSVDIGIELSGGIVTNLVPLLTRFARQHSPVADHLIRKIVDGHRLKESIAEKESLRMYIDYWDKEDVDSFDTMMRVLPIVAAANQSHTIKYVLERSLCILHFNKTSKLNSAAVARFPAQLASTFEMEEGNLLADLEKVLGLGECPNPDLIHAIDSALHKHRYKFEIASPLM